MKKSWLKVEFLYPPLEGWSQPSGDSPISKPLSHSQPATAIHIAGIPPAFILSSSLPWLPKPPLTQHTKLRDKERQGHMEGEENSASQPAQHGVYRQERKQSCPRLALGKGRQEGNTGERRSRQEGWGCEQREDTWGEGLLAALERGEGEGGATESLEPPSILLSGSGSSRDGRDRRRGTELRTRELSTPQLKGVALKRSKQQQKSAMGIKASSLGAQESGRGHSGERRESKV